MNNNSNNSNNINNINNIHQSIDLSSPILSKITADINNNNNNNTHNFNNNNNNNKNNYLLRPLGENNNEYKILEDPSNCNGLFQLFKETVKYYHCYNNKSNQLVFFSLIGSQSFNLNIESSDQDFFGVYKADIDDILSFQSYYYNRIPIQTFRNNNKNNTLNKDKDKDNIINPTESIIHLKPDITIHEIRYYFKLLLLGNPKIIEPLFIDKYCIKTDEWLEIIKNRKEFINLTSLEHFYSTIKVLYFGIKHINDEINKSQDQQQKTLNDRKSIFKKSYHLIRLLYEMDDIIAGNNLTIWLPSDSDRRKLLYTIRAGEEIDEQSCFELVDKRFKQFEKDYNKLKEDIERGTNKSFIKEPIKGLDVLNQILVKYRRRDIEVCRPFPQFSFNNVNTNADSTIYSTAMDVMNKNKIKGTLLYFGPSGSSLHNLQDDSNANNIQDWVGIYAAPTDEIVSLFPPPLKHDCSGYILQSDEHIGLNLAPAPNRQNQQFKKDTFSKGITLYEIKYALQLIVNGSYRLLECIFASSHEIQAKHPLQDKFYISDAWKELIEDNTTSIFGKNDLAKYSNSNLLQQLWGLSKSCNSNCSKFKKMKSQLATNQLNQLIDTSYSRNLFFSFHLLLECKRILNEELPMIYIDKDSENHQFLMKLKNNQVTIDEIEPLINENNKQLDEIKKKLDLLKLSQRTDILEFQTIQSFNNWYNKVRKSL
ncbi:hypothetical protein DICPUDRAFT_94265 [Dictyostelium purpureum]|uniref:Uncharacterized protein n=1 Tax=Dictyostelium purpureum TaxID=5786 RepID=F0ZHB0_DICPU|nr:uncharacterized protein DICPUDRAFT_94265 [Dictyostelium purpureum]EGC36636.1 hypothetical protein DICPUDRAFT_94265 [Dictyostelium purpureum]|eukprot:XP_003286804.1 hypothetical protein DICPUDRAFT_94265 [Dictyostelium purpureum]